MKNLYQVLRETRSALQAAHEQLELNRRNDEQLNNSGWETVCEIDLTVLHNADKTLEFLESAEGQAIGQTLINGTVDRLDPAQLSLAFASNEVLAS